MKRLFTIDLKDYDENWPRSVRPTVRGIIQCDDGKLAMIHKVNDYYAFPGGGIEEGESYHEALIREVREETGLEVIPETIEEFGSALRLNSSRRFENTIFEQENFYYKCKVSEVIGEQKLDEEEMEDEFTLEFVTPEEALKKNKFSDHGEENGGVWLERENKMLEIIIEERKLEEL